MSDKKWNWVEAIATDELPEGRVQSVTCGHKRLCVTHHRGECSHYRISGLTGSWLSVTTAICRLANPVQALAPPAARATRYAPPRLARTACAWCPTACCRTEMLPH